MYLRWAALSRSSEDLEGADRPPRTNKPATQPALATTSTTTTTLMPYVEERQYASASANMAPTSSSTTAKPYTPSVLRPSTRQPPLPSTLEFYDASILLTFMSSLASPSQLLSVTTLRIELPSGSSTARQQVGQVAMGVHLMLRYTHNLEHLYLHWADAPSSVLTGTSFRLQTFSSPTFVDGTVVAFLEAQSNIRSLELGAWGAHLPPPNTHPSSYASYQYPPAPPMLSPSALPSLTEFTGHAEVASQLAAGGRPLTAVHLISGLPSSAYTPNSAQLMAEWREVMSGLAASPFGVRNLSVVGVERFGLEMLAEIGRQMHDLDYLFVRVQKPMTAAQAVRSHFTHSLGFMTEMLIPNDSIGHLPLRALEELSPPPREPRTNRHRALRPNSLPIPITPLLLPTPLPTAHSRIFLHSLLRSEPGRPPEPNAYPAMAQYLPALERCHY